MQGQNATTKPSRQNLPSWRCINNTVPSWNPTVCKNLQWWPAISWGVNSHLLTASTGDTLRVKEESLEYQHWSNSWLLSWKPALCRGKHRKVMKNPSYLWASLGPARPEDLAKLRWSFLGNWVKWHLAEEQSVLKGEESDLVICLSHLLALFWARGRGR